MLELRTFRNMMDQVRQGKQEGATALVRHFGPKIRKAVRKHMVTPALCREIDTHDISQTVLAHFFLRNLATRFDLDHPDELSRLLVAMARNKVRDQLRKVYALRRDRRRLNTTASNSILDTVMRPDTTPSKIVAGKELIRELYRRLNGEERDLAEQRSLGLDWETIAGKQGASAEALRKKLTRALERVSRQLGLGKPS